MKKSRRTVVGIALIAAAIMLGIIIQLFGSGLITTCSGSVPPIPGQPLPLGVTASYTDTTYHWSLFALVAIVISGLLCLFVEKRDDKTG